MTTASIPDHILALAERLRTQDNRCTAHPMFCVQQHVVQVGLDESLTDNHAWMDHPHGERVPREHWPLLDAAYDKGEKAVQLGDTKRLMRDFERFGVTEEWETVMVSLTEQGAKDYLERNAHNLRGRGDEPPRIYVESFHRCREMVELREWLMTLGKK